MIALFKNIEYYNKRLLVYGNLDFFAIIVVNGQVQALIKNSEKD